MRKNSEISTLLCAHSVEITQIYCHHFVAKIPWNHLFTKELHSKLFWRKKICEAVKFSFFHNVCTLCTMWKVNFRYFDNAKIPWNQLFQTNSSNSKKSCVRYFDGKSWKICYFFGILDCVWWKSRSIIQFVNEWIMVACLVLNM